jgi:hypothetical protein
MLILLVSEDFEEIWAVAVNGEKNSDLTPVHDVALLDVIDIAFWNATMASSIIRSDCKKS